IRSPQWRGGGVVFGPTPEKNYKLKMNRKVRRLAMKSAYSVVLRDKQLLALESINFENAKTKDFIAFLASFETAKKTLIILAPNNDNQEVYLSARNVPNIKVAASNEVSVEDLLHYDTVMMTKDAINAVEEVLV
ncbi:MAG: 50S ribosomal protein L4, partial [Bacilli bacterium]